MMLKSVRQAAFTVATRQSEAAHGSNSWGRSSLKPWEPQRGAERELPLLGPLNPLRVVPEMEVTS